MNKIESEKFYGDPAAPWKPIMEEQYRLQRINSAKAFGNNSLKVFLLIVSLFASLATIWAVFFK